MTQQTEVNTPENVKQLRNGSFMESATLTMEKEWTEGSQLGHDSIRIMSLGSQKMLVLYAYRPVRMEAVDLIRLGHMLFDAAVAYGADDPRNPKEK